MSQTHNFRSAIGGFNRQDVVRYIEYINGKHISLVNQLKSENQALKDELAALQAHSAAEDADLRSQLDAALARIAELESQPSAPTEQELEAYRRAERMERIAKERADAVYHKVNATLAEASTQLSGAAGSYGQLVDSVVSQISQLQAAVESGKIALENAAAAMGAIRPEGSEE
jgi:DNA repair exonuclease SbcCD ATPase subunit